MKLYKIKKSDIDKRGRGLYATRDIKEGTKIIDYVGKLITKKQTEESDKYDNNKPIYLFTINKRYTKELCDKIIDSKYKFTCFLSIARVERPAPDFGLSNITLSVGKNPKVSIMNFIIL